MQRTFSADMTAKRYNNVLVSIELLWAGSTDRRGREQTRARNVPLASADVRGGGVACVAAGRVTKFPGIPAV